MYVFSLSLLSSRCGTHCALSCFVQSRGHKSATKAATLQIRFVIIGGGPAGLACAVVLRRVGHHVIVLEKGPDFIGVHSTPTPSHLTCLTCSHHCLIQPSRSFGFHLPPNMTKILNYWAMRDKVEKISITTDRIIFTKCMCCSLLIFVLSYCCVAALQLRRRTCLASTAGNVRCSKRPEESLSLYMCVPP